MIGPKLPRLKNPHEKITLYIAYNPELEVLKVGRTRGGWRLHALADAGWTEIWPEHGYQGWTEHIALAALRREYDPAFRTADEAEAFGLPGGKGYTECFIVPADELLGAWECIFHRGINIYEENYGSRWADEWTEPEHDDPSPRAEHPHARSDRGQPGDADRADHPLVAEGSDRAVVQSVNRRRPRRSPDQAGRRRRYIPVRRPARADMVPTEPAPAAAAGARTGAERTVEPTALPEPAGGRPAAHVPARIRPRLHAGCTQLKGRGRERARGRACARARERGPASWRPEGAFEVLPGASPCGSGVRRGRGSDRLQGVWGLSRGSRDVVDRERVQEAEQDMEMTMTANEPCHNGCTRKDESGELIPLRAGYGVFCGRCFRRAQNALEIVGPLVEHLLSLVPLGSAAPIEPTGIHGTKAEPPIPGRWEALSDVNFAYAIAARWCRVWAYEIGVRGPQLSASSWIDDAGRVVGLRTSQPGEGMTAARQLTVFLGLNLEAIFDTGDAQLISAFLDDLHLIGEMRYRWPMEDRPVADKQTTCPACERAGGIVAYPPSQHGQDQRVECTLCGHRLDTTPVAGPLRSGQSFMPNEYEMARLEQTRQRRKAHAAAQRKIDRARRDQARLARSYALTHPGGGDD